MNAGIGSAARITNSLAAAWLVLIAVIIVIDVIGRGVFDQPVRGVNEIVANSIVSILFLQMPLTIFGKSMIRATLVHDHLNAFGKNVIDTVVCFFGIGLFTAIAVGGWPDMILGWEIGETEGTGALEVPVYPARTIIVFLSGFSALIYLLHLWQIWNPVPQNGQHICNG